MTDVHSYGAQLAWEGVLDEIEDYLEQREDIRDGGDGKPLPNEEMRLLSDLRWWRPKTKAQAPVEPGNTPTERKPSAEASGKPGTEARHDQLINALLTFAGPQVLYEDLPDEVRRVCKQAADALCGPNSEWNAAVEAAAKECEKEAPCASADWQVALTSIAAVIRRRLMRLPAPSATNSEERKL